MGGGKGVGRTIENHSERGNKKDTETHNAPTLMFGFKLNCYVAESKQWKRRFMSVADKLPDWMGVGHKFEPRLKQAVSEG